MGVHERSVEAEANQGHLKLSHHTAGEAAAVILVEIMFYIGQMQAVEVHTCLYAETKLSVGLSHTNHSQKGYKNKFAENFHICTYLICFIGHKVTQKN